MRRRLVLRPSPGRSGYARGKQQSSEQDLENQNDDQLSSLGAKISALRGVRSPAPPRSRRRLIADLGCECVQVTQDIYDDSRGQNSLLDGTVCPAHQPRLHSLHALTPGRSNPTTIHSDPCVRQSNAFDSFKTSLGNTSTRFARSVQSGKGGARIQLGIVAAFVLLFLLYKVSPSRSATPAPSASPTP